MATSLQHISEKMMKMDIDKVGAQSLGLSLIPAVPDKFLIKYDPPKICVVYHFKDHNAKDQYWRDIPLEVDNDSTAKGVTDLLFKEHSYYFDSSLITTSQVEKLIQMVIKKNSENRRSENMKAGAIVPDRSPIAPNKGNSKIAQSLEQARQYDQQMDTSLPKVKKGALEPLKNDPKKKLEPIENSKKNDMDDFDFLGLGDDGKKDTKKDTKKENKNDNGIDDNYDFDFEFEDVSKPEDGSKMPPVEAPKPEEKKMEVVKDKKAGEQPNNSEEKTEEDEYIIIDGKRFREIQIEGEEDEYLMDDDGNIYDKEGQYIGTAKDGGDEEEETEEDN